MLDGAASPSFLRLWLSALIAAVVMHASSTVLKPHPTRCVCKSTISCGGIFSAQFVSAAAKLH